MNNLFRTLLILPILMAATASIHAADSPYSGQEKRTIKALSEQEISDYLTGQGMGTSKAAELNHYPGPRHVLDDANKLGLSAEQLARTTAIHQDMRNAATRLGQEIVQKEAELEALYAHQKASAENTSRVVKDLAALQADFRLAHLNAHLLTREVLTPQQIALYDSLRGYDKAGVPGTAHQHH